MRTLALLLLPLIARGAAAQVSAVAAREPGSAVSGVIVDSLAGSPLRGALVQLAPRDRATQYSATVSADSIGRFRFDNVPDGLYLLGFYHPLLDSLFLEPAAYRVTVSGAPVVQDIALPSPSRLHAAICGASASPEGAVLIGVVRDAGEFAPVAGVNVAGEWLELSIARGSVGRRTVRLVARTGDNGWFALCDVPKGGTISIIAVRGADSTDRVSMPIPANGFARGDLYLGTRSREGRTLPMRGTVTTPDGRPLPGAQVAIELAHALANEQGDWSLDAVPSGTRVLEVRAVGYYPERRRVDVVAGAPPIRTALSTLKAVLDTIRVTASRVRSVDLEGFRNRMRTAGFGHFITPEDIARRNPMMSSDVLRTVPGLQVEASKGSAQAKITMRGLWVAWPGGIPRCSPLLYIDGQYMGVLDGTNTSGAPDGGVTTDDIDHWISPRDIAGIEVYTQQEVPPQFSRGMAADCGSIVIWSKRGN